MGIPLILFKAGLFALLCAVGYLFVFRLRSRLFNRVLVTALLAAITVFLAAPNLSTRLAQAVGIGRGADLLFYLAHIGMALLVALLYVRTQDLSARVTQLTRVIALMTAKPPAGGGDGKTPS